MTRKLKYACVGAGGIARKKHLAGYARLKDVELCALCDMDKAAAERLAADCEAPRVYTDFYEMLEKETLDIVSICTPNFTHKPMTIAALQAGANVHLEKPIAMNALEAAEIVAAERNSGKQVMQGMNKRFLGQTVLLQRLLEEGFFGEIYRARCGWERNSGIPGIGRWFTDKKLSGGGALIDLGAHYLDLTMELMGWPTATAVLGNTFAKFEKGSERIRRGYRSDPDGVHDVEDMATGLVRMSNGATLDFVFSWASNRDHEVRYVEFFGTRGGCQIHDESFRLFTQLGGSMFTLVPDDATIPLNVDECGYFVDCVRNGKRVGPTADQGVAAMKIIDALYLSAARQKEILL
jgi:predicted dehydrogenase